MKKIDFKERIDQIHNNAKNNDNKEELGNPNDRECPFSGKVCNKKCKLFRSNREGYECPFMEIPSMSWNLKSLIKKLIG